eukprot:g12043.t1
MLFAPTLRFGLAVRRTEALDWYEESWTTDVSDLSISMPEVWATARDAAEVSQQGGESLRSNLLAAAEAARAKVEMEGMDPVQQARESSIATAETARRMKLSGQLAAEVVKEEARNVGLSEAAARDEAQRALRLVDAATEAHHWSRKSVQISGQGPHFSPLDLEEIWKIAMEAALASEDAERPDGLTQQLAVAAKSAAAFCQDHGYDAAGQAGQGEGTEQGGVEVATLAVGEVARRLRGDVELRQSAAGFAAAQEAQRLGLTPSEAAEESALARRLAGVRSGEEARTVVQGSTMHFASAVESVQEAELEGVEADAAEVLGKDLSSLETRSMLVSSQRCGKEVARTLRPHLRIQRPRIAQLHATHRPRMAKRPVLFSILRTACMVSTPLALTIQAPPFWPEDMGIRRLIGPHVPSSCHMHLTLEGAHEGFAASHGPRGGRGPGDLRRDTF